MIGRDLSRVRLFEAGDNDDDHEGKTERRGGLGLKTRLSLVTRGGNGVNGIGRYYAEYIVQYAYRGGPWEEGWFLNLVLLTTSTYLNCFGKNRGYFTGYRISNSTNILYTRKYYFGSNWVPTCLLH